VTDDARDLMAERMSDQDDLIAASRRVEVLSMADLQRVGPPIRLRHLCALTGFSKMKFFAAIERGDLDVTWIRTGQTKIALIDRVEARRYLTAIGFAA